MRFDLHAHIICVEQHHGGFVRDRCKRFLEPFQFATASFLFCVPVGLSFAEHGVGIAVLLQVIDQGLGTLAVSRAEQDDKLGRPVLRIRRALRTAWHDDRFPRIGDFALSIFRVSEGIPHRIRKKPQPVF